MNHLVLVGRNRRHLAVRAPRFDEGVGELAAGLDEERAGAHCWIADLEVEDLAPGSVPGPSSPRRLARTGARVWRTMGSVSSRGV